MPFNRSETSTNETTKWTGADGQWEVLLDGATSTSLTFSPLSPKACIKTSGACDPAGTTALLPAQTMPFASPNVTTVIPIYLNPTKTGQITTGVTAPAWAFAQIYDYTFEKNDPYDQIFGNVINQLALGPETTYRISPALQSKIESCSYSLTGTPFLITVKNGEIVRVS